MLTDCQYAELRGLEAEVARLTKKVQVTSFNPEVADELTRAEVRLIEASMKWVTGYTPPPSYRRKLARVGR